MSIELRTDWTIWLQQQQRIVVNFLTRFILVLGLLGLMISLERVFRERTVTFNTVYYVLSYVLLLILFLVRKIPDTWRSIGFMILLYVFGSLSLYIGWLAGGGRTFLLTMIVVSAILINPRAGLYSAALVFLTFVFFGLAFSLGWLKLGILPDPTGIRPVAIETIGFVMNIIMVTGSMWFFGRALMAADQANREAQDARTSLDAKTRELEIANQLIAKQSEEALKYSEEKFHNVIAQATDAIVLCDEQGLVTDWNNAAEQITGIPRGEAIGCTYWDIQLKIMPDERRSQTDFDAMQASMVNALQTGQAPWMNRLLDYQIQRPDGKRGFIQQIGFPIQTAKGYMIGSIIRDITDQKQIAIERENLIQKLENQNAELERFTYTVSHDLKTPLVTIRGYLGYLEQDAKNGDFIRLEEDMRRIEKATDRMHSLLRDILELSRIGRLMNPPENIPFEDLVREAVELAGGILSSRGVQVAVDQNLPIVHGDHQRLLEVLQNLIDNAAKFMGDQPDPQIEIGQRGEEGGKPVFFVKDNGMGIAPEYHERVFGLFNKLDARSEGTGIGLALVKRIIEFHGGRIWIEGEIGKGTAFYFTLSSG
jgi:two-component system sensor kinase FixL